VFETQTEIHIDSRVEGEFKKEGRSKRYIKVSKRGKRKGILKFWKIEEEGLKSC
jgi:hypothetical protein